MCEWCTRGNEFDEHGCEVRGGLAVGVRLGQHRKHLERGGREGREVGGRERGLAEIRVGGEGVIRECCMKEGLVAIMVHRKRPWNIEGV